MSMKNPLTPAGIEPDTFRCVAQYHNHCATAVPYTTQYHEYLLRGKGGRCLGLTSLPQSCADCIGILGFLSEASPSCFQ